MYFLKNLIEMVSTRPAAWPCAFWVPCFLLFLVVGKWPIRGFRMGRFSWWGGSLGLFALGAFGWFNYRYQISLLYLDHAPSTIVGVSWYFAQGHPLYHGANSPEIYSFGYGPYLYLFTAAFEKLLGPSVFAAKLTGFVATFATTGLLFVLLWRRTARPSIAIFLTGVFACLIVTDSFPEYLNRPDNFIVLFVLIGACAAYSPWVFAPVILGASLGICVDLKAHAFLYFIPLAWLAWRTGHRWKGVGVALGVAAFFALLPFLTFSNISLGNYLWVMIHLFNQGLDPSYYMDFLLTFAGFSLPFVAAVSISYLHDARATSEALRRLAGFIGWIVFSVLVVLLPASKQGAGPHHLLPMVIILLLLAIELSQAGLRLGWSSSPLVLGLYAVLASWFICCFGVGVLRSYQYAAYFKIRASWADHIDADVQAVLQKYGSDHILLMGAGDNDSYEWTAFRTELIFHGQPVGIDPTAWMEVAFKAAQMPSLSQITSALSARQPGRKIIWLIPQGAQPFSMHILYAELGDNGYLPNPPAYNAKFRADFSQDFSRIASTPYFDLYSN